jgi:hypothetical protein
MKFEKGHFLNEEQKKLKAKVTTDLLHTMFNKELYMKIREYDERAQTDIIVSAFIMFCRESLVTFCKGMENPQFFIAGILSEIQRQAIIQSSES